MENQFSRTQMLIGATAIKKLQNSHVAVFGVGGVGSFTAEALARAGVGHITIFDNDIVALSNINRQLIATHNTIGKPKVEVMRERILSINPNAAVTANNVFYTADNALDFPFSSYDYVVDAIDTVKSKLTIIETAAAANTPIISSMGTGNKLDPTKFVIADIYKTSICPLARAVRNECKKRHIKKLKVLYSTEYPTKSILDADAQSYHTPPASISFVPSVAGLIIAGEVIKSLIL